MRIALKIETGRYSRPSPSPLEDCVCDYCGAIANEEHFLVVCERYNTYREKEKLFSH